MKNISRHCQLHFGENNYENSVEFVHSSENVQVEHVEQFGCNEGSETRVASCILRST